MRCRKEPYVKPKNKPADSASKAQNNTADFAWAKPDATATQAGTRVGVGEEGEIFDAEKLIEGSVCFIAIER